MTNNLKSNFTPPHPLNTAVLFLVFNRLDTTKQVFEAIRQAKPPRLYIAADGARETKDGEVEKVNAVRDYITSNIDWECEVKTLFREENLGCKYAVSGAIDWFFKNEEMGIILEDDCLPSLSFFWFCEELLVRYKDDLRVGQVSGFNRLGEVKTDYDFFFSKYPSIWGWATWRNRWILYSPNPVLYDEVKKNKLFDLIFGFNESKRRLSDVNMAIKGETNTWDYQWGFTMYINGFKSIIPSKNLISNIGFGKDATHTNTKNPFTSLIKFEIPDISNVPPYIIKIKTFENAIKTNSNSNYFFKAYFIVKKLLNF